MVVRAVLLLAAGLVLSACSSEPTEAGIESVRINELQVVGSHNSYHQAPGGEIAAALEAVAPEFWHQLDYSHASITEQLSDHGIRQFEIDVYADPEGGHYASRAALPIVGEEAASGIAALDEPGFKTMHIQDFDFETSCLTFIECLGEIERWSSAHPDHVPIMVMVETKDEPLDEPAAEMGIDLDGFGVEFTEPLPMTTELFDDLEAEVLEVFDRDRLITPDDVRGDHDSLPEAIADGGWPTLGEARGKVLLALVDTGASADVYRQGAPALQGRLLFTSAEPGSPDAAFVRIDDPISGAQDIADALEAGYLVRTRSDTPTFEARSGDTARRDAALASGAQYISTDFYAEREEFGSGFFVELPQGAVVRCSPVAAGAACVDSELRE